MLWKEEGRCCTQLESTGNAPWAWCVDRVCTESSRPACQVIAIAYEHDPRDAHLAEVAEARADAAARANRARGDAAGERLGVPGLFGGALGPTPHGKAALFL